jgi:predicted nucleotidyltransferase component of viral defense system
MILQESYTPEWIAARKRIYRAADPDVMEKVIYAFALVELLTLSGLKFVLKGGTSLLLILPEPKRFSIDVDIVTTEDRKKIESILTIICDGKVFQSFSLDEDRSYKAGIPKAHYRLNYLSQRDNTERYILLDILYEEHGYHELQLTPIKNEWLQTGGTITQVNIPSIESIAGDKLTAFAPNTIGIPYNIGKSMEIMKQLFDIGILFDRLTAVTPFRNTFETTAKKEISYRQIESLKTEHVLNDIIDTSLIIAARGHKLLDKESKFPEIQMGLQQINSFIYNGSFRIEDAILASSKASYLAAILLSGYDGEILKWQEGDDIIKYKPEPIKYHFLFKTRNIPGGPLFYWNKALTLLKRI